MKKAVNKNLKTILTVSVAILLTSCGGGGNDTPPVSVTPTPPVSSKLKITSDQYAATLGGWFGLDQNELNDALPNLNNFSEKNLGFL